MNLQQYIENLSIADMESMFSKKNIHVKFSRIQLQTCKSEEYNAIYNVIVSKCDSLPLHERQNYHVYLKISENGDIDIKL